MTVGFLLRVLLLEIAKKNWQLVGEEISNKMHYVIKADIYFLL